MAIQHGEKSPTAGAVKTPAPSAMQPRSGGQGYGEASYNGPSSLPPGQGGPQSTLAKNLKDSVTDPLLDRIISKGTAKSGDAVDLQSPQTRTVSDHGYPAAHGHRSRTAGDGSPGGTVPSKTGYQDATPIRKLV
jgi:hypothetical protein